jgi:hypothetical protein
MFRFELHYGAGPMFCGLAFRASLALPDFITPLENGLFMDHRYIPQFWRIRLADAAKKKAQKSQTICVVRDNET